MGPIVSFRHVCEEECETRIEIPVCIDTTQISAVRSTRVLAAKRTPYNLRKDGVHYASARFTFVLRNRKYQRI